MKRRQFIGLVGGMAALRPFMSRAQPSAVPTIGFLSSGAEHAFAPNVAGFIRGLQELGYSPGQNVAISYRWADGQYDRLPAMAAELAGLRIAVLVASGGTAVARAAKAATATIPIIFATADDPVANGVVASLNRPGENITGVALLSTELVAKRLGLLRELMPQAKSIALLVNADNPESATVTRDALKAVEAGAVKLLVLNAKTESDIDLAFKSIQENHVDAVIIGTDPLYYIRRDQLIALAARYAVPPFTFCVISSPPAA